MFKQAIRLRPARFLTTLQAKRSACVKESARPSSDSQEANVPTSKQKKWDLFSAVYLERHPLILKPMNRLEKEYSEMLEAVEEERSHLSDFEIRVKNYEEAMKRNTPIESLEDVYQQVPQDFLDTCDAELQRFQPAPIITESDKSGDLKSLNRKLDTCLVLLTEHKYTKPVFIPPQGPRLEGETMRQAAERVLREACGPELKARFYGNAPVGFYKYAYPRKMRETGSYGVKVFFFMAKYLSGSPQGTDYLWLDRQELAERLPKNVHSCVSQFVVAE